MSETRALRDGFAAAIPQSGAEIVAALQTGLLSLDANVLLNFYRFSPAGRDKLLEVLRAAGDRTWVSHQAAREFWRNRCTAIDSRTQATEQLLDSLRKQQDAAQKAVDGWAKQTAVSEDAKSAIKDALSEGYSRAIDAVENEAQGAGAISYDPANDSVLESLESLLSSHVGPPLSPEEHATALEEGARRTAQEVPPGFRDADKSESGADGASGDYLVWLQSIREATSRGLPLVIVTGDEKDDWWWRHRGAFMGPRPELIDEFAVASGLPLFMLRPVQLTENSGALGIPVSPEASADVARASDDSAPRWSHAAIAELLKRLDREGLVQSDVIRRAAQEGGSIDREEIFEIAGFAEDRKLAGFRRPVDRIARALQEEGLLGDGVPAALAADYGSGVTAIAYSVPSEIVDVLTADDESTSAN